MILFHYFLSIFHHFSPLLSIHLFHCGKCGKFCGKLAIFAYKYPKITVNKRKIPINSHKIVLGHPFCFFYFLFVRYFVWLLLRILICSRYVVPLIYWEPMVPIPSFARKDFQSFLLVPSLRSGRRQTVFHLSNLTVLK